MLPSSSWYRDFWDNPGSGTANLDSTDWTICDYGVNHKYLASATQPPRLTMCRRASATVMVVESARESRDAFDPAPVGYYIVNNSYSAPGSGPNVWPAHSGLAECNAVFVDGHVKGAKSPAKGETAAQQLLSKPGSPIYGPWVSSTNQNDQCQWVRHDGIF
ncbi:hypothetical protein SDC9_175610 [bioreactor metagenome]|uniref:Uncharacterized protein n=1 Tax=bioreactor metagenome TaxID=1076179 RepID=A0A645GMK0_9ZZZZ